MKKIISVTLAMLMVLGLAACGNTPENTESTQAGSTTAAVIESTAGTESTTGAESTAAETSEAETAAAETTTAAVSTQAPAETTQAAAEGITIAYPSNMQEKGYTEPLKLEKMPEKVVSMSTSPVLAMHKLGVHFIAVPKSSVVTWPEDMKDVELLNTVMNQNFDIETVIAMEPDLVILGYTSEETYGKQLADAQIPVYYVDAGHTVSYESIKLQTQALVEAFGKDTEAGKELLDSFTELESKLENIKKKLEGKTVMVLQSAPPSHYIQTNGGTLGTMAEMIGLTNVYTNDASPMAQIDYEQALDLHPDLVLSVGMSPTAEAQKAVMEEDFAKNPEYWNTIEAIKDGNIIYLPVYFISSAGINVVDHINELSDIVTAHFGVE